MSLDNVKATIRALLVAIPGKFITINDLCYQYRDMEYEELPFRKFNYRNALQFLLSMPDAVQVVNPNHSNPQIRPVINEKCGHIAKLVAEQRHNTPKKRGSLSRPRPQTPRSLGRPNKNRSFERSVQRNPVIESRPAARPPLDENFKADLYRLLTTNPDGFFFDDFESHVRRLLGNHYLYVYEPSEVLDLVTDFAMQKNGKVYLRGPDEAMNEIQQKAPKELCLDGSMSRLSDEELSEYSDDMNFPSVSRAPSRCDGKDMYNDSDDREFGLPNVNLRNNLRSLFDEPMHANGIWLKNLTEAYQAKFFYPLSPQEYGYTSVLHLVSSLPDIFHMKQYRAESDYLLTDVRKWQYEDQNTEKGEIPLALLDKLKKLLKHEKQIYTEDFASAYQRMYQQPLRPEDYGFENMDAFFHHMEDTCKEVIRFRPIVNRTVIRLNYEQKPSEPAPQEEALPGVPEDNPFPPEVCDGDFRLDVDPIFEELKEGDTFLVNLGETYTPERFFITHISRVGLLSDMMADLNEFYECHGQKFEIFPSLVTRGLICACVYSRTSDWHRAEVMSVTSKTVRVCYVDYGTEENVDIEKLRYLHKDFAEHPPLCMRAKLSGIQPKDGPRYQANVNVEFLRLCRDIDLEVSIVHKRGSQLEVLLYTLSLEDKVLVQEQLISRGFVLPRKDVPSSSFVRVLTGSPETNSSEDTNTSVFNYSETTGSSDGQSASTSNVADLPSLGRPNTIGFFKKIAADNDLKAKLKSKVDEEKFSKTPPRNDLFNENEAETTELKAALGVQEPFKQFSQYSPPPPYSATNTAHIHPDPISLPTTAPGSYQFPYGQYCCPSYPYYHAGTPLASSSCPYLPSFQYPVNTQAPSNPHFPVGVHPASNFLYPTGTPVSQNFSGPPLYPTAFPPMPSSVPYSPSPSFRPPPGISMPADWQWASSQSTPPVGDTRPHRVSSTPPVKSPEYEAISPEMKKMLEMIVEEQIRKEMHHVDAAWMTKKPEQPTANINAIDGELESKLRDYLNLYGPQTGETTAEKTPSSSRRIDISESIPETYNIDKNMAAYYQVPDSTTTTSPPGLYPNNVRIPSSVRTCDAQLTSPKINTLYGSGTTPNSSPSCPNTIRTPSSQRNSVGQSTSTNTSPPDSSSLYSRVMRTPSSGEQLKSLKTSSLLGSSPSVNRTGDSNLNPIRAYVLQQAQKMRNN